MTKGKYSALELARYILYHCTKQKKPISNRQLQNILYFCWVNFYKETSGEYLFDDGIQAWTLGPTIPVVYYRYKHFCGHPIEVWGDLAPVTQKMLDEILSKILNKDDTSEYNNPMWTKPKFTINDSDKTKINITIDRFSSKPVFDLINLSCQKHSAWYKTYDTTTPVQWPIPFSLIIEGIEKNEENYN